MDAHNQLGILDQCKQPRRTSLEPAYKNKSDLRLGWGLQTPHTLTHVLHKIYELRVLYWTVGLSKMLLSSAFKTKRIRVYVCRNTINYQKK